MLGKRDKALLRATLAGSVWNGFFWGECVESLSFVHFTVGQMVMVIFSGNALPPSSLWFISGRVLNSLHWLPRTRVLGQGLCFGTVGFLVFLVMLAPPWALSDADVALDRLDAALGRCPPDLWRTWVMG